MSYNTPEGRVKKRGRETCRQFDLYYFPVHQSGMSKAGTPDDCVNFWGVFGHIEYKAHMRWDKNHKTAHKTLPTASQVLRMEECRIRGGITLVVDDANIDHLENVLEKIYIMAKRTRQADHMQRIVKVAQSSVCGWNWSFRAFDDYKKQKCGLFLPEGLTIPIPDYGCSAAS